jgi:hypothetical protein
MADEEQSAVELAARLHGFDALASKEFDAIPSLRDVSRIIRAHAEPASGLELPVGAQVVEAVNAYDMLITAGGGTRIDRRTAFDRLRIEVGGQVGAAVLDALGAIVGVRPRAGGSRRRSDQRRSQRGAA